MCVFLTKLYLLTLFFGTELLKVSAQYEEEDKLMLKPEELVDLIQKEQKCQQPERRQLSHYLQSTLTDTDDQITTEPEDDEALKQRKVWSRWSKWSKCSVTCGRGSLLRTRQCVAGRCAAGEREEQRRACARAPCASLTTPALHKI